MPVVSSGWPRRFRAWAALIRHAVHRTVTGIDTATISAQQRTPLDAYRAPPMRNTMGIETGHLAIALALEPRPQ